MKSKSDKVFEMLDLLFCGKYEPWKFSCDFPEFCYENYNAIEEECNGLGFYLDQEIPEICDEGEPGFDPTHMITELKKVYDKAKEIYNQN